MKILILIPLWKRPEVVKIVFDNLKHFKSAVSWDITTLAILCPYDADLNQLEALCNRYHIHKCYYPNNPLGKKINAGLNYALQKFDFDYLMNFGSDDLIHPDIENLYKGPFEKLIPAFGIDSLFFYDLKSKKTFYFHTYTDQGMVVGAGRMIHKSVLIRLKEMGIELYSNEIERCCDGNSSDRMRIWAKINNYVIPSGKFPYIVDIKTNTNINHIIQIEVHQTQIEYLNNDYLNQYFKL